MMRRFIPIIAVVVVLAGLGIFLYFYYAAGDPGLTAEPGVSNPFESVGGTDEPGTDAEGGITEGEDGWEIDSGDVGAAPDEITPRLVKITTGPVAIGALALDRTDIASTTELTPDTEPKWLATIEVRYAMRASGNVFSYLARENRNTRLSNRTVPGVQDARWLPDGSSVYLRYLAADADGSEHIETYRMTTDGLEGSLLARNLTGIDLSGGRLFTLMETSGGTTGSVSNTDGSGAATVFTSPITGLRAEFSGANLLAVTKPSKDLSGYAFTVNAASGAFTRILGPLRALSAIANPAGTQVLMSYIDGSTFRTGSLTLSDLAFVSLPLQTLAEKCVFSPDGLAAYCAVPISIPAGNLPDAWYQGSAAFTDRLWKIDFAARVSSMVADLPELTDEPIDAVGLSLNPNGTALVFTNRRDSSLWIYAL